MGGLIIMIGDWVIECFYFDYLVYFVFKGLILIMIWVFVVEFGSCNLCVRVNCIYFGLVFFLSDVGEVEKCELIDLILVKFVDCFEVMILVV